MAKTRLLQAVCTIALLAAAPAFAQQTETPTGATGPNGAPNPVEQPSKHAATPTASPKTAASNTNPGMAPANNGANSTSMVNETNKNDTGKSAREEEGHSTRHAAMERPMHAMHSRTDTSQDAMINRLNDQSYKAAEQGQTFSANGSDLSTPPGPMSHDGDGRRAVCPDGDMTSSAPGGSSGSK